MRLLCYAFLIFISDGLFAQKVIDVSTNERIGDNIFRVVGGEPFVNAKFVALTEGSPFFKDGWMKGKILTSKDQIHEGGILKLNLISNELHYLSASGAEMIATIPLKEIILTDTSTTANYHFIHSSSLPGGQAKKGWYLQMVSGKVTLFEFFNKSVHENKPYGSATVEQKILTSEQFFILYNENLITVKKAKDIPLILSDKQVQLEKYLLTAKGSTAEKTTSLIKYYNSL